MSDLVSIIIPIYNVEDYLPRCIDSLINQTYKNLEIILVNDGSKDNSGKICDEYAKKDSRVKVIHKENSGAANTRNMGIDNATGEYIGFVDSDDFVSKNFIKNLYDSIKISGCKVAKCDYVTFSDTSELSEVNGDVNSSDIKIIDSKELLKKIESVNTAVVWNKLFKRELFENLRFPVLRNDEDRGLTYKLVHKANEVCILNKKLYYYFVRPNSLTTSKLNDSKLDLIPIYYGQVEYFRNLKDCEEFYVDASNRLIALLGNLVCQPEDKYKDYNKFCKDVTEMYLELRPEILNLPIRDELKQLIIDSPDNLLKVKEYYKEKNKIKDEESQIVFKVVAGRIS